MLIGTAFKNLCYGSRLGFRPPCNTSLEKYRYGTSKRMGEEYHTQLCTVTISVSDPDPGSGAFLTGGIRGYQIKIRIRDPG
jgi:hypothetical protein